MIKLKLKEMIVLYNNTYVRKDFLLTKNPHLENLNVQKIKSFLINIT